SIAGYNIEFFEDVSDSADRGSYQWSTNTIRLNVAVGTGRGGIDYILGRTLSHELVHSIQRWNAKGYEELESFIIEKMGDSFEGMVSRKMKRLGLEYAEAVDEVIADGCEMMLRNSKSLTEFAKEHRTLFEKICDIVEEFINKIRGAISSLYGESTALHDEARFMELYADELQAVFDKVLSDALNASEAAVDHNLQSNANKKTAEDGGKVQKSAAEKYTEYDKPITVSDIETLRSIGRKSINDFTSEDIQKAQKWAYKFYKELGVKSPFFRAWFGDWRAYDSIPVAVAKIPEYIATNEARKKNRGTVYNSDTKFNDEYGWAIQISREGETNTISHSGDEGLSEMGLAGIRELIENAILLDSEVHEHHRNNKPNEKIAFDHKFYALGETADDSISLYKITVEEYFQSKTEPGNKKFHNLRYIEKIADNIGGRTSGKNRSGGSTNDISAINYSISDLFALVKQYDKEFKPKPVHGLLVEKGNPRKFYHGTNSEFFEFDLKKSGANYGDTSEGLLFFTSKKSAYPDSATDYAREITKKNGGKETVREVYISMQKPLVLDSRGYYTTQAYFDQNSDEIYIKFLSADYDGIIIHNSDKSADDAVLAIVDNAGQVKSATYSEDLSGPTDNIGAFDRGQKDIRYSRGESYGAVRENAATAKKDSEGRKLSHQQMEYFSLSVIRDKRGRLLPVYHGTKSAGFNVFSKSDDIGYFFARSLRTAETYSGTKDIYTPDRSSPDFSGAANYKVYLNITNPLIIEGKGAYWNNLEATDDLVDLDIAIKSIGEDGSCNVKVTTGIKGKTKKHTFKNTKDLYSFFESTFNTELANGMTKYIDMSVADTGKMDVSVQFPWNFEQRRESYDVKKTRDIVRRAYESPNRYDGVIFRNIVDAGTRTKITPDDVYVALKPEQIKSVNNTNPTSAMDIRYSRGEGYEANKKTAENGGKVQYSKEKRTFSYDELVKKDDLEVVVIGKKQQPKTTNGLIDDDYIVKEVKKQCKTLTTNGKPVYYVNVPDIGRNVEIVNDGITHGFSRPKDRKQGKSKPKAIINARVSLELPNILKNSIEINRSSRGSNIDVPFTHVMIGTVALEGTNGEIEFYAVRSMIQERKNQNPLLTEVNILGKLTSLKAKKIGSPTGQVDGNIVALTDGSAYRYSIADLLADVKSVFDDTFSNDVYAHFNMNRRNTKGFSEHLQYSRGEGYDPYAEYHYYENRKVYGESLVDALERTVETQEDQAIIDDYRKVEKEVDEMRTELAALNNEIFETIYTPMDQAEAYRIEGMRNDVKTLNREIRALEKEVKKARDNVTVTEGVIRDPQSSENARNSALIGVVQERQALTRLERTLAAKKSALEDITAQIDEARDPRRMKLEELREKAAKLRREISKADKSLLDLRSTKRFRTLLARERALAIKETKELMGRRQKESAKRQENTVLRQRIWNELQRLDKMLALPSVAKHIPDTMRSTVALLSKAVPGRDVDYDAKIAALEEKLENSTGQEYREARERMAEYLAKKEYAQRVTSALSDFFTSFDEDSPVFDEAVYKEIEALKKEIAGKSLDELDNSELKRLNDVICATKAAIKNADKVFGERRGLAELGMEGTEEVLSASDDTARGPARQKLHDFLEKQKYSMLKPYELFEITGSTVLYERFRKLQAREGVYYRNVNEASEYYKRVAKEHGITDRMLREKFSFTTSEGREIALSINEIMSIYLMKDRAQAMVHLTNPSGGFRFAGGYTVETKKAKAAKTADEKIQAVKYVYKKTSEPVHLTDVDVISIGNMLTKEQKAFANAIQRYMADVLGEKGNEVSMALHDFKKYNDPDYFPIHTDESYRFLSIEKAAGEIQLKNLGFTKDLKYKASGPLVLENMTDVFARHANEMSLYNAFAVELENMKRVLNYSPEGDPGGGMKAALGQALTDEIVDFIKSVNGGLRSESMGVADTMISLNKAARVGASLSVAIQQPSAILRSFAMIDPKYFAGIPGKGSWEEMKKYTATAGIKELGGVDVNTSRAITDQLTELEAKGRTAGANVSKAIAKAAFILPEVGDRMAWISLWNACKREAAQSYHGEAILIEAGKRFDEIVNRTQVYDSVFSRSKLMRSKNTFAKMVTAFMAEPMTTANMVLQAARDFKTGNKAKGIRAIAAVATSILINNALVAIIYAMRDDDEDESYIEKYIEAFLQKMGTDVNPVTYIPVFKDVLSLIQGYDVERMDMSLVSDVLDEAQALVNLWMKEDATTEEWMNAWLSFGGRILDFAGVPISNFSRDANAVFVKLPETWKTKSTKQGLREALRDGLFEDTLFEKFWKPSDTDANKLYRAIVSGDTARYKQITKRLDEEGKTTKQMQSLIVTGLKDNDERVSAAAEAKSSGDLAKYEKLLKEISKDGFASSYVAKAVDSVVAKMNAEPPEEDELGVPDPRENEKYSSIYNADDIFINLEEGDTKEAQIAIDDIYINKYNKALDELEDDEDEEDAVRKAYNSMRSMISSEYRELYKSGDDAERERIEELLLSIYVNGEQLYKEKTIEGWGEDD
ncbi:MAG: hypothetical protein IJD22_07980, partial [Clostridia bacterium]|nr:hypothetical protein [Clostridia bacterium]